MTEDERQDLLSGLADLLSEGCSLPFGMSDELDRYIWRCRRAVSMVMVDIHESKKAKEAPEKVPERRTKDGKAIN
jgi:hypothetical protein